MKKLRLKALSLGATEILSREQLKAINGGCTTDAECQGQGWCDSGTCHSDGGSGWGGSFVPPTNGGSGGLGEQGNCENGTAHCACPVGNTDMGCMTAEQCATHQHICLPCYPLC